MRRLIVVATCLIVVGCASLPPKQKATLALQTSETALERSHDAERQLCDPTAHPSQAIRTCKGAEAQTLGLTTDIHLKLAGFYSKAFDLQKKAAEALIVWRAGDPAPKTLLEYQQVLNEILLTVQRLLPSKQPVVAQAQEAAKLSEAAVQSIGGTK